MSISKFLTEDECVQDALELGLEAFFRLPSELVLDLDGEQAVNQAVLGCIISNSINVTAQLWTRSKDGVGQHVYLTTDRVWSYREAAALQSALGSDAKKEALTIIGDRGFSALYETPAEAARVRAWRQPVQEEEEILF